MLFYSLLQAQPATRSTTLTRMARAPSTLLALCAAVAALVLLPQPASAFVRVFGTKFADENCNEARARGGPRNVRRQERRHPRRRLTGKLQQARAASHCLHSPFASPQCLANRAFHPSRSTLWAPTRTSSGLLGGDAAAAGSRTDTADPHPPALNRSCPLCSPH